LENVKEHAPPPLKSDCAATEELHGGCCVSTCCASSFDGAEADKQSLGLGSLNPDGSPLIISGVGPQVNVHSRSSGVGMGNEGNVVDVDPDLHGGIGVSDASVFIVNAKELGKGHVLIGLVELLRKQGASQWTIHLREFRDGGLDVLDVIEEIRRGLTGDDWRIMMSGPLVEIFLHNSFYS